MSAPRPPAPKMPTSAREQLAELGAMFGEPEPLGHKDAADRAWALYYEAYTRVEDDIREAGLPIDGMSPFGRMFAAGHRMADVWKRRAQALDRALKTILASDTLTDEQRAAVVDVLKGKAGRASDPKLLTDGETALLETYREMTAPDRQMLRRLLARLASTERGR